MVVGGLTLEEVREALRQANEYLSGNLCFLEGHPPEMAGPRSKLVKVRLGVLRSREESGNPAPGVQLGRMLNAKGGVRVVRAASWDAHGYFMSCVYRINPDATIRAGGIARGGVYLKNAEDMVSHWPRAYGVICD